MSAILIPVILIIFASVMLFSSVGSAFANVSGGGVSVYDENAFQDYANLQYEEEFGSASDYEDCLLLVFLVEDEKYYDYAFIAWCGDHIDPRITNMFGDEQSKFGRAIQSSAINSDSYKYSMDTGIASVVSTMQNHVSALGLESSYTDICSTEERAYKSHLTNKTTLDITESTVNTALESFTEKTGIPVVVVVDDIDTAFPKTIMFEDIIIVIIAIAMIIAAIVLIVKAVKNSKKKDEDDGSYKRSTENTDFDNF